MDAIEQFDWYYCPGEALLSIGFYKNPYRQWHNARFRHIFAFDAVCNLYVGQYSVYYDHMNKICDLDDQRECGFIYPANSKIPPEEVNAINDAELCVGEEAVSIQNPEIHKKLPIAVFSFMETSNMQYLNRRLKKIAQRLYDYGMPKNTILYSKDVDLWNIRIYQILKDQIIEERPTLESLQAIL